MKTAPRNEPIFSATLAAFLSDLSVLRFVFDLDIKKTPDFSGASSGKYDSRDAVKREDKTWLS
jgi:hypothetical protein